MGNKRATKASNCDFHHPMRRWEEGHFKPLFPMLDLKPRVKNLLILGVHQQSFSIDSYHSFWNYLVKQHCFKVTEKINFFWSSTWISFLEEFCVHRVDLTLLTWPMGGATFKLLASIDPTGIIITNFLHRFKFKKKKKKLLRSFDPLKVFPTS